MATMPDGGLATEMTDAIVDPIIPKLDAELGLYWHLEQWLQNRQARS
jgi:hypothetical protein